jgi:hypothetical protein
MSPNLLFKLSWAPEIAISCLGEYRRCVCMNQQAGGKGGGGGTGFSQNSQKFKSQNR